MNKWRWLLLAGWQFWGFPFFSFCHFIPPAKNPLPACSTRLLWLFSSFLSSFWPKWILCILSLLISKSLAAPFRHQTWPSQPDYHISRSWAKPKPKSDLKPPLHTDVSCIDWFGKLCSLCRSSMISSVCVFITCG